MRPEEILPSLVELSIAVAGFSGVVAGIGSRRPSEWTPTAQLLFSALLASTLASTALSVLAMVLLSTPLRPETAWATISAVHAFGLIGIVWVRAVQFRSPAGGVSALARRRLATFLGGLLTLAAIQLANSIVFRSDWLCIAALGVYAFAGLTFFVLLVMELWGD